MGEQTQGLTHLVLEECTDSDGEEHIAEREHSPWQRDDVGEKWQAGALIENHVFGPKHQITGTPSDLRAVRRLKEGSSCRWR